MLVVAPFAHGDQAGGLLVQVGMLFDVIEMIEQEVVPCVEVKKHHWWHGTILLGLSQVGK